MRDGGVTSPTTPARFPSRSNEPKRARLRFGVPRARYSPMRGGQCSCPARERRVVQAMTQASGGDVLIVEDDPALREVYGEVLAGEGFGIRLAANGHEALALLTAEPDRPCAILLDLRMPGMNGWELADRLRDTVRW